MYNAAFVLADAKPPRMGNSYQGARVNLPDPRNSYSVIQKHRSDKVDFGGYFVGSSLYPHMVIHETILTFMAKYSSSLKQSVLLPSHPREREPSLFSISLS